MHGLLWLILQMGLLLMITAALFLWLGWQWGGSQSLQVVKALETRVDEESAEAQSLRTAQRAREEELRAASSLSSGAAEAAAAEKVTMQRELAESQQRQGQLERQLLQLNDDLRAARQGESQARQEVAESGRLFEDKKVELNQVQQELTRAQEEVTNLKAAAVQVTETPKPAVATKPKAAPKKSAGKSGTTAAAKPKKESDPSLMAATTLASLQEKVAAQEARLAELDAVAGDDPKLAQERDKARQELDHSSLKLSVLNKLLTPKTEEWPDDDLTQIRGIKDKLDAQLRAHGVRSYRQIAQWSAEELAVVSDLLAFKNRAQRDRWQEQARELHAVKYGETLG